MSRLLIGDCRDSMRTLIAEGVKVQMCVTSPPYWGLRDYGVDGQLGLEATIPEFIGNMVEVFDLVRQLLADDGTLWLNIGDSYATAGTRTGDTGAAMNGRSVNAARGSVGYRGAVQGLKNKDLCGIPWRLAFALQDAGWWLRQDIIWHKPNPMPESIKDRCTKAHEYIFLMAKSERYYYDQDAIAEESTYRAPGNVNPQKGEIAFHAGDEKMRTRAGLTAYAERRRESVKRGEFNGKTNAIEGREAFRAITDTRNRRDVWTVPSQPYPEAHFATYPPALIEPCILAGSKPGDIVFDPFFGSGTTGEVAQRLGREWIGCELNPEYGKLAEHRTSGTIGLQLVNA